MVIFQFASLDQQRNELLAILGWYLLNVLFYVYIYTPLVAGLLITLGSEKLW